MRARRIDANHTEIKKAFISLGCSVLDLYAVGSGCPDLLVSDGISVLVEIKTLTGELNKAQIEFKKVWKGPVATIRDTAGVANLVNTIRMMKSNGQSLSI